MLLVLGAAGFTGAAVARLGASAPDVSEVHCLVRRPAPELEMFGKVHVGDARRPNLGLDSSAAAHLAAETTDLVLTMGRVGFGMTLAEARGDHLAPLQGALQFARRCKRLRSVVYVSSIAAVGDTRDVLRSDALPQPVRIRNFYEWAKHEGERLVRRADLPTRVVRPAHIMNSFANDARTPAPLAVFALLPYLASGLPVVTGRDLVYWCAPVDFVAQVALAARADSAPPSVWAVDPGSPTLHELLDVAAFRHGLRAPRVASTRLARLLTAVAKPSWVGLRVEREVLPYSHAGYDLDLSCINGLIADDAVHAPPDRSYVTRTLDHEVERMRLLA